MQVAGWMVSLHHAKDKYFSSKSKIFILLRPQLILHYGASVSSKNLFTV